MNKIIFLLGLTIFSLPSIAYHKYNFEMGIISGNEGLYASLPDAYGESEILHLGGSSNLSFGYEYFINKLVSAEVTLGSYLSSIDYYNDGSYSGPSYSYGAGSLEVMVSAHAMGLFNNKLMTQFGVGINTHTNPQISYESSTSLAPVVIHDLSSNIGYDFEFRLNTRKLNKSYAYYFGGKYNLRSFTINNSVFNANAVNIFVGITY